MTAGAAERPAPRLIELGNVACCAFPWRFRGELRLTVLVKAAFELAPGGPMTPTSRPEIVGAEVHHKNLPSRSVRLTSDLVPYLPAADIVLTGDAHAPAGTKVPAMTVRLRVIRDRTLLERVIHVYGDRPRGGAAEIAAFDRVPLVYERAFGAAGFQENPLGTGAGSEGASPNLVDPVDPRKVACFAPVSTTWPARRQRIDAAQRGALQQPVPELGGEFPFDYFHAAPPEQRVAGYLLGNEWIVLDGMHPTHPSVHSRLPDVVGAARVYAPGAGANAAPRDVALVCDTLRIDAETMTATVVWRGQVPIADDDVASLVVVGAVAQGGASIPWPERIDPEARGPGGAGDARRSPEVKLDGTLAIVDDDAPPVVRTLPFVRGSASTPPPATTTAPKPTAYGETVSLTPEDEPIPAARGGLPFGTPSAITAPVPRPPSGSAPPPRAEKTSAAPARRAAASTLGIDLFPDGPLAIAVIPWGAELGRDALTVIAKATCDLVPEGPAAPRPSPEPACGEVIDGTPPRCVYPSDLVPYKVRADVVLVGHAVAPLGPVPSMEVAFRFGHEDNRFSRRALVYGDRRWRPAKVGMEPSEPEPFVRMPVAYHRAFGGAGFAANPDGLGHRDRMHRGPTSLPNLEDPELILRSPFQTPPPAAFAPIPDAWKRRWAALGETGRSLADALDWTRHQQAPRAQRLAPLCGDEPFMLAGFSAQYPVIEGALPGLVARCFMASEKTRDLEEVPLRLDTVVVDVDTMKVSLVWRGTVPVEDEAAPRIRALHLLADKLGAPMPREDAHRKLLRP